MDSSALGGDDDTMESSALVIWCVLLAGTAVAGGAPRLLLAPERDLPWVELRHKEFASEVFVVRVPEHIVTLEGMVAQQVKWEKVAENRWRFSWQADKTVKALKQTDFWGEVIVAADEMEFAFTIKNPTDSPWSHERYNAFDVVAGKVPMFHDRQGVRTFVYVKERFISVKEALQYESKGMRTWMLLAKDPAHPQFGEFTERLMAKLSNDGKWVLAIASDSATGVTFNLELGTSCIHQNRTWAPLQPGEERTLRGKVYLFRGTLDDLLKRYQKDKEKWQRGAGNAERGTGGGEQSVAYLPTVWAAPTKPRTLTRLQQMRPKELSRNFLAMWVADRLARDTNQAPTMTQIREALKRFQRRGAFLVRQDASGLWMSNGLVGIALLPPDQGCGIASLYHLPTRTECIFKPPQPHTLWRLMALLGHSSDIVRLFPQPTGSDLSALKKVDGADVTPAVRVQMTKATLKVTLRWQNVKVPEWNGALSVEATVAAAAHSPLLRWRIKVEFRTTPNAERAADHLRLVAIDFPVLKGLGAAGENDVVTSWGSGRGQLFRGLQGALWNSGSLYPDSNWALQFLSMSFGKTAVYFACHDGKMHTKSFRLQPGHEFCFIAFPPMMAEASSLPYELPYDIVIGPVAGDWFDIAQLYRKWALQQTWCAKGPLYRRVRKGSISRRMVEAALWVRPNWTFDEDDDWGRKLKATEAYGTKELEENAAWFGQVPMGVWWYKWHRQRFDDDTPAFDPYPQVPPEFQREAADGLVVMPYTQSAMYDVSAPTFDAKAQQAACKTIDGAVSTIKLYWCTMAHACLSQRLCQDVTVGLARRLLSIGANAIYLDVFPVLRECHDTTHGHPLGVGGNWWAKSVRGILERIKQDCGSDFGIAMEYFVEPYVDLCDVQMAWWDVEDIDCPLVPAIYSGYAVQSGSSTHKHFPDDLIAFRIKVGRCFLWGSQLGHSMFSEYLLDAHKAEFMKQLVLLKARARSFLTFGQMLRPPKWLSPMPQVIVQKWMLQQKPLPPFRYDAVESALWRAPDGRVALFIVNYDDRPHTVRIAVGTWWERGRHSVWLLTSQKKQRWKSDVGARDHLSVDVPPASAMALAFDGGG